MSALSRRSWMIGVAGVLLASSTKAADSSDRPAPALMLAGRYHPGLDISAYWVSEKYDGLRGYWDGQGLFSRGGQQLHPPAWFTQGWPSVPMDGELWAGRGRFEEVTSTVRQQVPNDAAWHRIRFMVFDLPAHPGVFDERLLAYQDLVRRMDRPWVVAAPQDKVLSHEALRARLQQMVRDGGEGLMLHHGSSTYRAIRSDDLVKLKTHDDAEAKVIEHLPGKGRLKGRMGAMLVETPTGLRFRLGSGFTDQQRQHPPAKGSWVTYRYRGFNESGLPRFATFLRERPDFVPPVSRP